MDTFNPCPKLRRVPSGEFSYHMGHSIRLRVLFLFEKLLSKSNSAWQCLPLQVKSCLLKLYFTDFKQRYKLVQKVIDCTFEEFKWVAWVIRSRWVIAVDPSLTKDFDVPWLEITGKTFFKSELNGRADIERTPVRADT